MAPPEQKEKHHNNPIKKKIKDLFHHRTPQLPPQTTPQLPPQTTPPQTTPQLSPQPTPQPASGPTPSSTEKSYADIALTVGDGVISTLKNAASVCHIPGLQLAAGSVLAILQAVRVRWCWFFIIELLNQWFAGRER